MSDKESQMSCPGCGATMNHHADKIDYNFEDQSDDPVFGGILQEVHTCADCGRSELRKA